MQEPREDYIQDNNELETLLNNLIPEIKKYNLQSGSPSQTKVVNYLPPDQLKQQIDFELQDSPTPAQDMQQLINKIMFYSVRTNSPRFFDKLYVGTDPIGQISEFLIGFLNTNVHTYAVAPVFAIMERFCVKRIADLCGYQSDTSDGIFVPGGTYANMSALIVARHERFPHVRAKGWQPKDKPVMFTSVQSHYSVSRGAMLSGMGMDNCIKVNASKSGSMDVNDLELKIQEQIKLGKNPFFISATSGTTVMGGFDNIKEISVVAKKYGIWLHVDACWGGTALFSDKLNHKMVGIELSDSCAIDPHKGLGVPIQTTILVTNNKLQALEKSNSSGANYLFHDHEAKAYDLGDKSLQCGRRADSLKMWLSWKRHGLQGFKNRVEKSYNNAQYFKEQVLKRRQEFYLVCDEVSWNVCFYYIPKSLQGYKNIEDIYSQLDKVTSIIYQRQQKAGTLLINYNPLVDHGLPRFIRITLNSPKVQKEDLDFALDEIHRLGQDIVIE